MPPCMTIGKKTNITQNFQKIELCVSLTTKSLKMSLSPTQADGEEMQTGMEGHGEVWKETERYREVQRYRVAQRGKKRGMGSPISTCSGLNWERYFGSKESQPQTRPPSPGF